MGAPRQPARDHLRRGVAVILVTVGTQLPFDRLIRMMDAIAPTVGEEVVAQIGTGSYEPRHMQCHRTIGPSSFDAMLAQARVIVSHAGIGSVLVAQKVAKPIVLVARRAALGEHRNDHQLATAASLTGREGVYIAGDEAELSDLLSRPLVPASAVTVEGGRARLRASIAAFIRNGGLAPA
jgi:UDP-N-acetylglucosamine transferase subunit ALG13